MRERMRGSTGIWKRKHMPMGFERERVDPASSAGRRVVKESESVGL